MGDIETRIKTLDEFVHRPTNYVALMKSETKRIDDRFTQRLQEMEAEI